MEEMASLCCGHDWKTVIKWVSLIRWENLPGRADVPVDSSISQGLVLSSQAVEGIVRDEAVWVDKRHLTQTLSILQRKLRFAPFNSRPAPYCYSLCLDGPSKTNRAFSEGNESRVHD